MLDWLRSIATRECHGLANPHGSRVRVVTGAGAGGKIPTRQQPSPVARVTQTLYGFFSVESLKWRAKSPTAAAATTFSPLTYVIVITRSSGFQASLLLWLWLMQSRAAKCAKLQAHASRWRVFLGPRLFGLFLRLCRCGFLYGSCRVMLLMPPIFGQVVR